MGNNKKMRGRSYLKQLEKVIKIYDKYAPLGVPNAVIWRNYIYPEFYIAESTFKNYLKNAGRLDEETPEEPDPNQLKIEL